MSVSVIAITAEQKAVITRYVNVLRAKHQAPPMIWDSAIEGFSRNWANYLVKNNLFQHSDTSSFGENLAYFQGHTLDPVELIKKSIDAWYDEVKQYKYDDPQGSPGTGHFTCLVWKSSTNMAFGISVNRDTTKAIIVMNTSPPGNVYGQYIENVLPLYEPEPVPEPVPGPEPIPAPGPEPVPAPEPPAPVPLKPGEYEVKIHKAINITHNIIYLIQIGYYARKIRKQVKMLYDELYDIPSQYFYNKQTIMGTLSNIIHALRRSYSKYVILRIFNNILIELKKNVSYST